MANEDQGTVDTIPVAPVEPTGTQEAGQAAAAPQSTPEADPNAELWKKLESLDPAALPKSVKDRFELPFKQDYTKKWEQLANDKNRFLSLMAEKLGQQGGAPPPQSALQGLREKIQQGDYSEFDRFVEQAIAERTAPIAAQVAQREAFEQARQLHPYVTEREGDIAEVIRTNPTLAHMAVVENFKFFPIVAQGIALSLENQTLKAQAQQAQTAQAAAIKKGVEAELAKVRGLPASTTRVGTNGTATPTREYKTFQEAAEAAMAELMAGNR